MIPTDDHDERKRKMREPAICERWNGEEQLDVPCPGSDADAAGAVAGARST